MSLRTRVFSALLVLSLLAALIVFAGSASDLSGQGSESLFSRRETINLWYSDDALTDYLTQVAVEYNDAQQKYRIEPKRISEIEYLETISRASVENKDFPDLYVLTNNLLEKAAAAGLAASVQDEQHFSDYNTFPESAIHAVTYRRAVVAYPFYYETSALLYNRDLLQQMAEQAAQKEADLRNAEALSGDAASSASTEEEAAAAVTELEQAAPVTAEDAIPRTVLDIIRLADSYDAPAGVEAIFKWDVSDIFYNYYFVGNAMDVGGPDGDDPERLDIYNADAIQSLQVYQQLGQFFSIDSKTDHYETVIEDFADGKIVFTVATTDAAAYLAKKGAEGKASFDYGVTKLPDMAPDLQTKAMNVTDCIVINGYSRNQEAAGRFAEYMLYGHLGDFYDRTGKAPAISWYQYSDPHMNGFFEAYTDSVPITKMREASNFWMFLENTLSRVWNGADPNEALRSLYVQTMLQFTGKEIDIPKIEDLPYLDISAQLGESN